ncbi:hypothetical protein ANANG_G00006470 [Anguilla anguilla]|uniref:Zyxin n=1 Tax=Anguilla anguilla TaxID=7936 RepID=A0A9D3MWU6_ANGAN|nr:hypothetical protein ANANG_G00006470 [Anguilla anguilla]
MGDSGSSKPLVVTSSLSFKVTTPSFYNQPKKFASVAPPRPKSQIGSAVGTAVIGRVGELPPPPPAVCEAASNSNNAQRFLEKQTSFDRQLDSLTDMLSEMETRGPFNPKMPSQVPLVPTPKPFVPPPTAPKPGLSFLPPPELQDRPPPAPWAEELKLRQTNRHANQPRAPPRPAPLKHSRPPRAPASAAPKPAPGNQARVSPPPVSPQPKAVAPPPSSQTKPMGAPASKPSAPGPGGVPLSMKEVEELERMTQDFIKDMDTHAPVITSPPTERCGKCGEALSRAQPAVRAMDKLFHSDCFCCMDCQRTLQGLQFYDRDGQPQCEDCYVSSLAVCARCNERVTDRVLKAVGQTFHAHCFRCCTCSCSLEGAPFITDDNNNPYCVADYHRRFSPLCVSCNEPIVPDPGSEETVRVVALEKNFHLKCYRCEDCARPLSIEADADGCYPLDGRILCMKCHTQRAKQAAQ